MLTPFLCVIVDTGNGLVDYGALEVRSLIVRQKTRVEV